MARTSSPSLAKSEARIEGAILVVFMSARFTGSGFAPQPGGVETINAAALGPVEGQRAQVTLARDELRLAADVGRDDWRALEIRMACQERLDHALAFLR